MKVHSGAFDLTYRSKAGISQNTHAKSVMLISALHSSIVDSIYEDFLEAAVSIGLRRNVL